MTYTYDQFVSAAQSAGMYDSFTSDDLTIARSYPEYGMSLLKLRQEYNGATTAEQRLLAQEAINQLRQSYTPGSSSYSYSGQEAYDKALQDATNYPEYSYDYRTDPSYNQTKNQYQADLRDSTGQVVGNSAVGNSQAPGYAGIAAGQSANYYNTRMNDVMPTIEQNAYNQYLQSLGIKNDQLSAAAGEKSFDYNKWLQEQNLNMNEQQQNFSNQLTLHQNFGTDAPSVPDLSGGSPAAGTQYSYGKDAELQNAMDAVMNQEGFSYDPSTDPLYGSLRKSYLREGQRAGENAMAVASAGTGGVPSSFAIRSAADAQNGYIEQLMNGVPTLENNAYSRYLQEFEAKRAELDVLKGDRDLDYNQWLQNYQLEQQRKQQTFDNAMALYSVVGLTPEIAAILGVPYMQPGGDDAEYVVDNWGIAKNFVNRMLNNATNSRFDPERVINGTPEDVLTAEQKIYAQEYLKGVIEGGGMKGSGA